MDWWIDETPPHGDTEELSPPHGPLSPGTVMAIDPAGRALPAYADSRGQYAIVGILAYYSTDSTGETIAVIQTLPATLSGSARYITSRCSDAT